MASAKGGSGKTIIAATFATVLSAVGYRVMLVDADAATNGLTLLYLKEVLRHREELIGHRRRADGLFEAIQKMTNQLPAAMQLSERLFLVPAAYSLVNTEDVVVEDFDQALRQLIHSVHESVDFVVVDAQAGADPLAATSMHPAVSDEVIIVSEYDPLSAAGIERLKSLFPEHLVYPRTWVLLNKVLPEFVQSFSDFLEVARYLPPIPWDADVVRAYSRRRLALDLERGDLHTVAVIQTLKTLLGEEGSRLDDWLNARAVEIREPALVQLDDAKRELEALRHAEDETSSLFRRRIEISKALAGIGLGVMVTVASITMVRLLSFWIVPLIVLAATVALFQGLDFAETVRRKTRQEESRIRRREAELEKRIKYLEVFVESDSIDLVKRSVEKKV